MQQTVREKEQDGRTRADREKRESKGTYSDHTQKTR